MDPTDQPPIPQQPQSPLDAYMANYGEQLQSMLASDPNSGGAADPGMAAAGTTSDLGNPDFYQTQLPPMPQVPQQSAMSTAPAAGPGSAQPQGTAPSGGPAPAGPAPQSALTTAPSGSPAAARSAAFDNPQAQAAAANGQKPAPGSTDGDQNGLSFRQLFQQQPKDDREKYVKQLQAHLKQADQTIDSAYKQMMDKLGGKPDPSLTKQDKGMLLMEFGMRMMEHSRSQYGQTNETGAAFGQAGTETIQSAKGMIAAKQANQQRYDQMQQQLTIAQGKEKSQLASRSALEAGRDARAFTQQDAMLERVQQQQQGANDRNANTVQGANDRNANTVSGANARAAAAGNQVKRTVTGDDGSMYGVTGNGQLVQLGKDGNPIKANPGGGSGGGKQTAAQANYNLYVSTYGKDKDGNPLTGEDLQSVQREALNYAAAPSKYKLSDPQIEQMAEKSGDSFVRANPTAWMGKSTEEIAAARSTYVQNEISRLKSGRDSPGASPGGALTTSPARTPGAAPRAATPGGPIPVSPQPGGKGPNAAQLQLLNSDPKNQAANFLKYFGYLPREYQSYVQSPSALSR